MSHTPKLFLRLLMLFVLLALPVLACDTLIGSDADEVEATRVVEAIPGTGSEEPDGLDADRPTEPPAPSEAPAPTEPPPPTEPPAPTDEPEPTAVPEPAGPVGPVGMGRDNPYPVNEFVQAPNWDIQVLEVKRGEEAWQILFEADEFNDPPPEGMEYLMVMIYATSTYEDDEPHSIDSFDFEVIGDHHILYDTPFVWNPEPEFGAELYTGGETEGWATYLVGSGEGNLILILDEWANFDDDRYRYLALDEGASLTIPAEFAQIGPNDVGLDRENPAAFGETAVTDNWEVTVLEVVRGDAAAAMAQEADEYYEPSDAGFEYVLARVRARNIGTEDFADWVDSSNFGIVGDSHVVYQSPYLVVPHPDLDYHTYPGADVEGWVSLQAAEGEGNLILILNDLGNYDDDLFRYMALEEGASLTIPAEFAQIGPNDVGLDRENPAAFGETAVTDNWEVTVLEVVRGDAAAAMAEEADEFFNDPPDPGFEYVLVRVRARSIGTEDSAEWLDSSNFGIVGDQNVVYETPWLVAPHPDFDYNIYPGADVEGWVSLQAAEGEGGLIMTFESYYDYSDDSQRFFALE